MVQPRIVYWTQPSTSLTGVDATTSAMNPYDKDPDHVQYLLKLYKKKSGNAMPNGAPERCRDLYNCCQTLKMSFKNLCNNEITKKLEPEKKDKNRLTTSLSTKKMDLYLWGTPWNHGHRCCSR